MDKTLDFPGVLRLIDERSAAFRAAVAAAPTLDTQVPTCPEWTLLDLVHHLGEGRFAWAATVAAGPGATARASADGAPAAPAERDALPGWLAASTEALLSALREAGPERGCWTWWEGSQSPGTAGAVARHQLQQVLVHTYDAQLTVGAPEPLPVAAALDGVDEFLSTCVATPAAWPHEPVALDFRTTEGPAWRLELSADGARAARLPESAAPAATSARGTAADLVLHFYGRLPLESLELTGDRKPFEQLIDWDPTA